MANGLDSGDESGSFGSRWSAGGRTGQESDSSFPTAKNVRAFDALAAALAETEEFSAAVDAAEQASTIALTRGDASVGRRHRAADAPLPPGLAVSPAGIGCAGWSRAARRGRVNAVACAAGC